MNNIAGDSATYRRHIGFQPRVERLQSRIWKSN